MKTTLFLDTGFLYAQLNGKDKHHAEVSAAAKLVESDRIILPIPVIPEVT